MNGKVFRTNVMGVGMSEMKMGFIGNSVESDEC